MEILDLHLAGELNRDSKGSVLINEMPDVRVGKRNPYMVGFFTDQETKVEFKIWEERTYKTVLDHGPGIYDVEVTGSEYNGYYLTVRRIQPTADPSLERSDFLPSIPLDQLNVMWKLAFRELRQLGLSEQAINLAKEIINDPELQGRYSREGAATFHHDNRIGGLAHHSAKMLRILAAVVGNLPPLRKSLDLLFLGVVLHDVYPTSGKLAALKLLDTCLPKLKALAKSVWQKAEEFDDVVKVGRTQLQDAVPIRLGQEFAAYARAMERGIARIESARTDLYQVNMGATAIGTSITAKQEYVETIVPVLAELTGYPLVQVADLVDGTQHIDLFINLSAALKQLAVAMSKVANDLRLMSMGPRAGLGEISLEPRQNGSSIMPGKINPVIPEVVSQVCFAVCGNDLTISMAAEGGQLELNPFEPVMFYKLFESIEALGNAAETFDLHCIQGVKANRDRCNYLLDNSLATITALAPIIGYTHTSEIAKEAMRKGETIGQILAEQTDLQNLDFDQIMDPRKLTEPFAK